MNGRRIVVSGHVQGVGFRAYAAACAVLLGLRGEVFNTTDGKVVAHVAGPPERICGFMDQLQSGPGRVDSVLDDGEALVQGQNFVVGATRTQ